MKTKFKECHFYLFEFEPMSIWGKNEEDAEKNLRKEFKKKPFPPLICDCYIDPDDW